MRIEGQRPNVLLILVDEQRYPVVYETEALRTFRREQLPAQEHLRRHAVEFHRHYTASAACSPSRASLFTGHYPSLHGVTQTAGMAKRNDDPAMHWLAPDTVPTLGDYFRAAGYRTYYKGKWHISDADLLDGASGAALATSDRQGRLIPANVERYLAADALDGFGFSGWIGPEPHGAARENAGINRDPGFAVQTVDLIEALEKEARDSASPPAPWLVVSSFLNPHDIVLFGLLWWHFGFPFSDDTVPDIPAAPTRHEDLDEKPRCQASYRQIYSRMFAPQPPIELYRKLYYYLHKVVDHEVWKVYERLKRSIFYENTVVVFTSDHGELLGAHGGLHQKWHNAYEETVHVPLMISNPVLFPQPRAVHHLTSHVDLLPTLLGLVEADLDRAAHALGQDHRQVRTPVGRDLSSLLLSGTPPAGPDAVYFMTDDEISSGQTQTNVLGLPFKAIAQPNHVETVITSLPDGPGRTLWKYSRYFDPAGQAPDEFELYDLSHDVLEEQNLTHPKHETALSSDVQARLDRLLAAERDQKRLRPE